MAVDSKPNMEATANMMATPGAPEAMASGREGRGEAEPFGTAAAEQDGEAEHQKDGHFQPHQQGQDAGAQFDVQGTQAPGRRPW